MPKFEYESEQERKDEEDFNNEDHQMNFGERAMPIRKARTQQRRYSGQPEQIIIQAESE